MVQHPNGASSSAAARIVVVASEPILSQGLAALLDGEPGLSCESVSGDFATAVGLVGDGKIEALVVDESLVPGGQVDWTARTLGRSEYGCVVVLGHGGADGEVLAESLGRRGRRVDTAAGTAAVAAALRQLLDDLGWRAAAD